MTHCAPNPFETPEFQEFCERLGIPLWTNRHQGQIDALDQKLDTVLGFLKAIYKKELDMSAVLEALKAQVAETVAADKAALVLIQGLIAKVEELKEDPVALQALIDDLKAHEDPLSAAVVENTPSAPTE